MVTAVVGGDAIPELAGTRFSDVRWVAVTGSTNADLLEAARAGAPEGVVLVADHQTAGRGRAGRRWVAPPGSSLLVSVLLRPPAGVPHAHHLTAVVAVAASDACWEATGVRPRLKWPNDLVVDDRKLAGVLAESVAAGGRLDAVVVGLGLNVNWPAALPEELAGTATALNHLTGAAVDRRDLLVRFLVRLDEHYGALCEPGGWRGVVLNERRLSATLGRDVEVELPGGEVVRGRAVEIGDDGTLLVEEAGALRRVTVGDVVHLRPRSPA
jgi:BirA family biotin operon repressor/biotin-[acetyl-CoA-carboxylase] ligase